MKIVITRKANAKYTIGSDKIKSIGTTFNKSLNKLLENL